MTNKDSGTKTIEDLLTHELAEIGCALLETVWRVVFCNDLNAQNTFGSESITSTRISQSDIDVAQTPVKNEMV